jgi:hypothetical protein
VVPAVRTIGSSHATSDHGALPGDLVAVGLPASAVGAKDPGSQPTDPGRSLPTDFQKARFTYPDSATTLNSVEIAACVRFWKYRPDKLAKPQYFVAEDDQLHRW